MDSYNVIVTIFEIIIPWRIHVYKNLNLLIACHDRFYNIKKNFIISWRTHVITKLDFRYLNYSYDLHAQNNISTILQYIFWTSMKKTLKRTTNLLSSGWGLLGSSMTMASVIYNNTRNEKNGMKNSIQWTQLSRRGNADVKFINLYPIHKPNLKCKSSHIHTLCTTNYKHKMSKNCYKKCHFWAL